MPPQVFNLKFTSIELVSKFLYTPPILNPEAPISFNFNFNVDIKVDVEKKMAVVISEISINEITHGTKLANFKTACLFEVADFEKIFVKAGENTFDIPVDLEIILKSAGISTTRGVIFSELRGTYLHGAILPLIDIATPVRIAHEQKGKLNIIT